VAVGDGVLVRTVDALLEGEDIDGPADLAGWRPTQSSGSPNRPGR